MFYFFKELEMKNNTWFSVQRDSSTRGPSKWPVGIRGRYSWPAARCVGQPSYDWENSDGRPPVARWGHYASSDDSGLNAMPNVLVEVSCKNKKKRLLILCATFADTNFVLANYKTDQCTKPPRLCRQGYACPHYHNSRDRRRNPRKFKYRWEIALFESENVYFLNMCVCM